MEPLSALKMMSGSPMGAQLDNIIKDTATKPIPLSDLEKLGSTNSDTAASAAQSIGNVESGGGSFSNLLSNFVSEVNAQQGAANDAITGLMSGKNVSLHQAMISSEEASVSFQMMVEVRNKLLDSYQELMRMQI